MNLETEDLSFSIEHFDDLSKEELYEVLWLRNVVFVVGQKVTAVPEIDGIDGHAHHVMVRLDDRLVGTARIFADEEPMTIGRIAVDTDLQRSGIGTWMMERIQEWLGERPAEMHAQAYLEDWYASLGWERFGEPFEEAEIAHVHMRWAG